MAITLGASVFLSPARCPQFCVRHHTPVLSQVYGGELRKQETYNRPHGCAGLMIGQPRVLWTGTEIEMTEMAFEARKLLELARPGVGWLG